MDNILKALKNIYNSIFGRTTQQDPSINVITAKFIDFEYYLTNYYFDKNIYASPIEHYNQVGWKLGHNPNLHFDTQFYLDNNPDVKESGMNPLYHYILFGKDEGRTTIRGSVFGDTEVLQPQFESEEEERLLKMKVDAEKERIISEPTISDVNRAFNRLLDSDKKIIIDNFNVDYYSHQVSKFELNQYSSMIHHYFDIGHELNYDPCDFFSTNYYLIANPDLKYSDMNPFLHFLKYGVHEGRAGIGLLHSKNIADYNPLITAIVPNYNHARFLEERVKCIVNQTYTNIEILILDDKSIDDSVEVINKLKEKYPTKIRTLLNKRNSGNVFKQWQKGIENAKGEIIWICESDDFCELDFVENTYKFFRDPATMISFGRIQFANYKGDFFEGLDNYREQAESGIWNEEIGRPAAEWFNNGFGVRNIIPNVGGCLIRKQKINPEVWTKAKKYKILGDWFLYLKLSRGGKIYFTPKAVTYFRQHEKNTSVTSFKQMYYYDEHYMLAKSIKNEWNVNNETLDNFYTYIKWQYNYHFKDDPGKVDFDKLYDYHSLKETQTYNPHILIGFLGFKVGGGEFFPIHLANILESNGFKVSMLAVNLNKIEKGVKDELSPNIPVYSIDELKKVKNSNVFLNKLGINLINTHYAGVDLLILNNIKNKIDIPYVVTLHGSYEVTEISNDLLLKMLQNVDHWIYTANKNLSHLKDFKIDPRTITQLPNAMPVNENEFDLSEYVDFNKNDVIYTFVARAIESKGWRPLLKAFNRLNEKYENTKLLLVGKGDIVTELKERNKNKNIIFLGFQFNIHGLFRMSDVCVLPTRFKGESYPLILIQAMQVGLPIISVDIGEISSITVSGKNKAALLQDNVDQDEVFIEQLYKNLELIYDNDLRSKLSDVSFKLGENYSMNKVSLSYKEVFEKYT